MENEDLISRKPERQKEKHDPQIRYVDEDTKSQFIVYSSLPNEKDQGIALRKLYDKSNKYIVFEDVVIGAHT
ncbi:MAG: hypothetical protein IKH30_03830, partial [Clostridia bacterium]|nr:hypothetical protein [Clostridia bacterium]MBR4538355.1 hypothetical protein [Clostridia bacterium]